MSDDDGCRVTASSGRTTVRSRKNITVSRKEPAMILGDLIVLIVIIAPVLFTVLALRANPRQLVDRFAPAVR
jgi:hypothetical protein